MIKSSTSRNRAPSSIIKAHAKENSSCKSRTIKRQAKKVLVQQPYRYLCTIKTIVCSIEKLKGSRLVLTSMNTTKSPANATRRSTKSITRSTHTTTHRVYLLRKSKMTLMMNFKVLTKSRSKASGGSLKAVRAVITRKGRGSSHHLDFEIQNQTNTTILLEIETTCPSMLSGIPPPRTSITNVQHRELSSSSP